MKKDNVKGYLELVEKDNSVKLKLKEKLDNYKGDMADTKDMTQQVIIPIAKDLGFSFTAEEYIKYLEDSSKNYELSDDDLFQVAGGTGDVNVENNKLISPKLHNFLISVSPITLYSILCTQSG